LNSANRDIEQTISWHHALQTASLQRGEWDLVDCIIATHNNPYGNAQLNPISNLVEIDLNEEAQTYNINVGTASEGVTFTRLSAAIGGLLLKYPPKVGVTA